MDKLNMIIKDAYDNSININKKNNIYDIELPLFLNTGTAVDIQLIEDGSSYLLRNTLHRALEEALVEKINIQVLREEYLFNNKKFVALKTQMLEENIELNFSLEKRIPNNMSHNELKLELFKYIYLVVRYYNYIYDNIIETLNYENQVDVFKKWCSENN